MQLMQYPPELITHVQNACQEVEAGLASRAYPFDYEQQVERYRQIKAQGLIAP